MNSDNPHPTIHLEEEMERSYLDYAMSVIVARALPDVRDGLKPVHRRILYAMKEAGYDHTKPWRKSARIVGDVMGKYHPHGDSAIYDALVRMAQNFSMRLPLIDGQGNFGSMDGDPAAAMRYTEARLGAITTALLGDIGSATVDFRPNYDGSTKEPEVLPACFPQLLVNGSTGIAVGMATSIPPHNLGEVLDACILLINNPDASNQDIYKVLPAPDFPTGAKILGTDAIKAIYEKGNGSIKVRAEIKTERDGSDLVITEIPYQVNKSRLLERIAECVRDKTIGDISHIRDESDRHGVRVVLELKRGALDSLVLNKLYRHTPLETSIGINLVALHKGAPGVMSLREMLTAFLEFRENVIYRRTVYFLRQARSKAHKLIGLSVALANIDEVIALIRSCGDTESARQKLCGRKWNAKQIASILALAVDGEPPPADAYILSEEQANAILALRLQRLTALERDKIEEDLKQTSAQITEYLEILGNRQKLLGIMATEMEEIKAKFANPRRTELLAFEGTMADEDLIERKQMIVTLTHRGYIKRTAQDTYRSQRRGGVGRTGMVTADNDFVVDVYGVNTHTMVLFFSSIGKVYSLKVYNLPELEPRAKGQPLVRLLSVEGDEKINILLPFTEDKKDGFIILATKYGFVRKSSAGDFEAVRRNGKKAIKFKSDQDCIVGAAFAKDSDDVFLATRLGKSIRFNVSGLRTFSGLDTGGVRGINLAEGDWVISMAIISSKEELLLTAASNGLGKLSSAEDYRTQARGGKGIKNLNLAKNAEVVASLQVERQSDIMLITNEGQLLRCPLKDVRKTGRVTRGVKLLNIKDSLEESSKVISVARISEQDENPPSQESLPDTAQGTQTPQATTKPTPEATPEATKVTETATEGAEDTPKTQTTSEPTPEATKGGETATEGAEDTPKTQTTTEPTPEATPEATKGGETTTEPDTDTTEQPKPTTEEPTPKKPTDE